ncbi:transcription factor HHO2 isoform X2 [Cryptomeria japonica]|uniref:transcription factor HHO2 isoform X2 n=1 Tax=Cryptomeria japonica TaxID=3369 RepID=UPI0027DA16EC|nr:transcription factor HHO2 isoform X2 [Cryptomeria japonica]
MLKWCDILSTSKGLLWDEMEITQQEISPCELTLECRPSAKRSHTVFGDETQQLQKYLRGLQMERHKIEAFKRELPHSMQLLDDAIEASEQQLGNCEKFKHPIDEEQKSVLQEFIPVKKPSCEESVGNKYEGIEVKGETAYTSNDMPKWMISTPLWSHNYEAKQNSLKQQDSHPQQSFALHRAGGAFSPFSREQNENPRYPHPDQSCGADEVDSHAIPSCKMVVSLKNRNGEDDNGFKKTFEAQDGSVSKTSDGANTNSNTTATECQRKPRRCWSQELHRKFVDALQHLGGSQATPKQIRELMKVDGLTNDEVKSHLQKYRLHTRRLSPPSVSTLAQPQVPPHLVVVGGIWVHPEHASTRGQGLYAALPAIQHGHFYCQPSNPAINGAEDFCPQRINTPLYEIQEEPRGSPQSWGMGVYTKSKSFDMKEEDEDSERGNEEITRNIGRGLSLRRCSQ